MDIPTTLVFLIVLVMAGAYVAQPFIAGVGGAAGGKLPSARGLRQRANLLGERNRLYADLRDLDADFSAGGISQADYAARRMALIRAGVETLAALDRTADNRNVADPIETAVRDARTQLHSDVE